MSEIEMNEGYDEVRENARRIFSSPVEEPYKVLRQYYGPVFRETVGNVHNTTPVVIDKFTTDYAINDDSSALIDALQNIISHPDIVSTDVFLCRDNTRSPYPELDIGEHYLFCRFFVPNPDNPEIGDLYWLGRVFGDPCYKNILERNFENGQYEGGKRVNDQTSRLQALELLGVCTPHERHEWKVVLESPSKDKIFPASKNQRTIIKGYEYP